MRGCFGEQSAGGIAGIREGLQYHQKDITLRERQIPH
jgi:hypothetical protein